MDDTLRTFVKKGKAATTSIPDVVEDDDEELFAFR